MGYRLIPIETPLRDELPVLRVECARCKRDAPDLNVQALAKRFGANISVGDLARKIALSGKKPCGLAEDGRCGARAWEPPVWHWAELDRAWRGGWIARLHCRRDRGGLKVSRPCPETVIVDVETSVSRPSDTTSGSSTCRRACSVRDVHSEHGRCEWVVPDPVSPPFAPAGRGGAPEAKGDAGAEGAA